ncbi:MAG: dihydroorotate dehydrogenase electron transfer subunit [Chitinispirillaceae bacterium]|nr:dihydroorotate dehydrogenase electron transfer subunit [Chitinispirillaceae bacterium]
MRHYITPLLSNTALCTSMYQLDFHLDDIDSPPRPGQFFTVRITDSFVPLLRRPFAFSRFDVTDNSASCIYQVRGNGTKLLSTLGKETPLDIIAPLGKPFPLPQSHQRPLLVAGGIGLSPILFLADELQRLGADYRLAFGCRSAAYLPDAVFENRPVAFCTDDGSREFHGTAIDYLKTIAPSLPPDTVLYCCGPYPMLHGCQAVARNRNLRCYVAMEQVMACGVGACMGCAVRTRGHQSYVRACKDGPVFDAREIEWE